METGSSAPRSSCPPPSADAAEQEHVHLSVQSDVCPPSPPPPLHPTLIPKPAPFSPHPHPSTPPSSPNRPFLLSPPPLHPTLIPHPSPFLPPSPPPPTTHPSLKLGCVCPCRTLCMDEMSSKIK